MIDMSPRHEPMKLFRAIYRERDEKETNFDLLARDLTSATLSATELAPSGAVLLRVFHNPEW
jgi:hypothetical protein